MVGNNLPLLNCMYWVPYASFCIVIQYRQQHPTYLTKLQNLKFLHFKTYFIMVCVHKNEVRACIGTCLKCYQYQSHGTQCEQLYTLWNMDYTLVYAVAQAN